MKLVISSLVTLSLCAAIPLAYGYSCNQIAQRYCHKHNFHHHCVVTVHRECLQRAMMHRREMKTHAAPQAKTQQQKDQQQPAQNEQQPAQNEQQPVKNQ